MSTQAQAVANKANAQHSTGPRTEQGKAAVSTNATTHGATSKQALVKGESLTEYRQNVERFNAEFKPTTEHETVLVQLMADSAWRLRRLRPWELQLLEECSAHANPFADDEQFKKLNRAHRHIQSIERSYNRAHRELTAARKPAESEPKPAKTESTKQTQSIMKTLPVFENKWDGKINIGLKNPLPTGIGTWRS